MTKTTIIAAVGTSILALMAGSASAQDWNGLYIGVYGGAQKTSQEDSETIRFDTNLDGGFGDTVRTTAGVDAFSPGFCGGTANGNNAAAGCSDDDEYAGEAGARAGYDIQRGNWVVGVLGEIGAASVEDNVTGFSTTPASYTFQRDLRHLAAARARVGYAFGRFLPYVTAGWASGQVRERYSTSNVANSFTPTSKDSDVDGAQFGAGIETHLFDRMTVGVEYVYSDLELDESLVVRTGVGTAPATNPFLLVNAAGTDQRRSSDSMELHGVRVTAAIRF